MKTMQNKSITGHLPTMAQQYLQSPQLWGQSSLIFEVIYLKFVEQMLGFWKKEKPFGITKWWLCFQGPILQDKVKTSLEV